MTESNNINSNLATEAQVEHSLIERSPERELLPMAHAFDIGVTGWSPLGSGILTGKYSKRKEGERIN